MKKIFVPLFILLSFVCKAQNESMDSTTLNTYLHNNDSLPFTFHLQLRNAVTSLNKRVSPSKVETLTNKRINPRVNSSTSSSTPTPNADNDDIFILTAQAATATFGAPSGTPVQGQILVIRIKDNGSPQTLAWNAIYRAGDIALPATTVTSKTLYLQFIYNSTDSKWDFVSTIGNF